MAKCIQIHTAAEDDLPLSIVVVNIPVHIIPLIIAHIVPIQCIVELNILTDLIRNLSENKIWIGKGKCGEEMAASNRPNRIHLPHQRNKCPMALIKIGRPKLLHQIQCLTPMLLRIRQHQIWPAPHQIQCQCQIRPILLHCLQQRQTALSAPPWGAIGRTATAAAAFTQPLARQVAPTVIKTGLTAAGTALGTAALGPVGAVGAGYVINSASNYLSNNLFPPPSNPSAAGSPTNAGNPPSNPQPNTMGQSTGNTP